MDAVIHSVSKIPSISKLLSITHHDYLPFEYDAVKIDTDIYFQLLDIRFSEGNLENLKFRLFCYNNESIFLQSYVESCLLNYDRHMSNKLGTNKYFFDMMVQTKSRSTIQNNLPSNYIIFTKHKFQTSRTFNNVFFDERDNLKNHTEFFLDRKDWYQSKGIPHTLGFMFHGEPGCGKTSTIKAIANVGKRHIINIHLAEIKSKEQLNHLFFNDEINVWDNGKTERYTIPVNERMYVIEDIDAMGDIVLKRDFKKPEPIKKEIKMDEFGNIKEEEQNPIDLSFLLNLLDGTLESEGRIIAITTNYPERIDKALIRPGRIDMIVHFKKCSLTTLCEMVECFYDIKLDDNMMLDNSLNEKWTPAEINQVLFRNFKDSTNAMEELKNLNPADLYGFKLE
jgi:predicted transcriptional regulator